MFEHKFRGAILRLANEHHVRSEHRACGEQRLPFFGKPTRQQHFHRQRAASLLIGSRLDPWRYPTEEQPLTKRLRADLTNLAGKLRRNEASAADLAVEGRNDFAKNASPAERQPEARPFPIIDAAPQSVQPVARATIK